MTVLFDMDGTLLPMDTPAFANAYFSGLARTFAPRGYEPQALVDGIWKGTKAMIVNDGSRTNEQAFWQTFASILGERVYGDQKYFDEFYRSGFGGARSACGFAPQSGDIVAKLKARGDRLVLASNPVFPRIAHAVRAGWAGVDINDFDHVTSYENSHYCKPNPAYYSEILAVMNEKPENCVMIGNDATEDLAAARIGIKVFILTPCLINSANVDISAVPHGEYKELVRFLGL